MDNIRVKKESLYDWRSELKESTQCECEGCGQNPCVECGEDCHNLNEEVQGGVNVENYADGVEFNEIETVDIIKAEPLDASNWRSDLGEKVLIHRRERNTIKMPTVKPGQFTSTGDSGNAVPLPEIEDEKLKSTGGKGKVVPLPKVKPGQFKEEIQGGVSKEVVSASYEADLENMVLQILEEDITDLYNEGFSYDEVVEFYGVEEDLTEAWGLLAQGAFQGAKMLATKVAPKVIKYVAKRGAKDIKTVAKFARNPKNWARANKDIDKVGKFAKELPARVFQSGKALRGATNKGLLNPAKDVADKLVKSQEIANRAINIKKISANRVTKDIAKTTKTAKSNFTKSKVKPELRRAAVQTSKTTKPTISPNQARAAVETSRTLAKPALRPRPVHVSRQKITQRGNEELLKLQGRTKKQLKAKELLARMDKAISRSKKPGTMSDKTDKIISQIRNDKGGALVKSKSNKITTTSSTAIKPKSKTTSITKSKTKTEKPASKSTVNVKATEVGKGSKATQKKIKMAREWQALNKAAGATLKADKAKSISDASAVGFFGLSGLEAGLNVGRKLGKKKAKSSAPDSPKDEPKGVIPNEKKKEEKKSENKTISNTEKKTVDPKKNPKLTPIQKLEKKRKEKLKYGTSGSHLSPLEQEMAN